MCIEFESVTPLCAEFRLKKSFCKILAKNKILFFIQIFPIIPNKYF